MDAFLPGVGNWRDVWLRRDLWNFHFYGETPLALVDGRERIHFEHFWNDFAADLEFDGIGGTIGGEANRGSRMNGESVFLLWYVQERDGKSADLLIGVYCTEADAEAAIDRLKSKAGFMAAPEGFRINRYELNRDHWEDGYVTGEGGE